MPLIELFCALLLATPGCSAIKFIGLRPLSGNSRICLLLTVLLNSPVVAFSTSVPADTVTVSANWPTSSVAVIEYSRPMSILTLVAVKVLKPLAVIFTV
jgi:hypothetical protein